MTTTDPPRPPRLSTNTPKNRDKRPKSKDKGLIVLVVVALLPVLMFSLVPLVQGIFLAFTDSSANRQQPVSVVGLDNFVTLVQDRFFWDSIRIGLIWAVGVTALQFFAALGLALLLNQDLKFRWFIRTLALIPWAMPPVVIGFMWKLVYHPSAGLLNDMLTNLGIIQHNIDWLGTAALALPAIIIVGAWADMPRTTVVLLAGLQAVDKSLHESAALDGANAWQRFRAVTWPTLKPIVMAITALDFIWAFNSFGIAYVLTEGGPGGSTRLPMLFSYEEAFTFGNYGYASAVGCGIVLLLGVFVIAYLRKTMREQES
ncbi:MAG: carbohydrate ABC transporter permease [Arachnia sp.]